MQRVWGGGPHDGWSSPAVQGAHDRHGDGADDDGSALRAGFECVPGDLRDSDVRSGWRTEGAVDLMALPNFQGILDRYLPERTEVACIVALDGNVVISHRREVLEARDYYKPTPRANFCTYKPKLDKEGRPVLDKQAQPVMEEDKYDEAGHEAALKADERRALAFFTAMLCDLRARLGYPLID